MRLLRRVRRLCRSLQMQVAGWGVQGRFAVDVEAKRSQVAEDFKREVLVMSTCSCYDEDHSVARK